MDADKLLVNEPRGKRRATVVLAHGAGAAMDTPFMDVIAEGLAAAGIRVVRFEFPYMRLRRTEGRRKGPDPPAVLMDAWRAVVKELGGGSKLIIGGKSLGGRIASLVADELGVRGLVCLGYPFHPPGQPAVAGQPHRLRIAHLLQLKTPTLILQGERDPFGSPDEVKGYKLSRKISVAWIPDGDHSFKPRKQSGRTEAQNLAHAVSLVTSFVASLAG